MQRRLLCCINAVIVVGLQSLALAGGSGLNVAVVVNKSSPDSIELGNYFCERRQVPPQNLFRINWTNGVTTWTREEFENTLAAPLQTNLAARQLTNQIEFVVLSMGIPHTVVGSNGVNSTTSALFYGFKADEPAPPGLPDSCSLPAASSNSYAGSEDIFRNVFPGGTNFLVTMITASNLAQAKQIIDQGVNSDGTFPTQTVVLAKTTDAARNVRYLSFDNAIFNTRLRGNYSMVRTDSDSPLGETNLLGYQTGLYQFGISSNVFAPGAMADSLTSLGGKILGPNDHTTLLSFIHAGAAGSYGTVVEPCNYLEKFPSPQNYFYQARGFSLAECYYQSLTNPYQGLIVGEPLAAPFSQQASGFWYNSQSPDGRLPDNALLIGTTNLGIALTPSGTQHTIDQVDIFVDGQFFQTIKTTFPEAGDVLSVTINGYTTSRTNSTGETIQSVASSLTAQLNAASFTNLTKVRAFAHGDRIELQSFDQDTPGSQTMVSVANFFYLPFPPEGVTFISASRTNFLDTIALGFRNFSVTNSPLSDSFLQLNITKTNGSVVSIAVTNDSANTNISTLVQQLVNAVNTNSALLGADGLMAEDFIGYEPDFHIAEFNLRARSIGLGASQIQVTLTTSPPPVATPAGLVKLNQNLNDLQPRNHLYISAGLSTKVKFHFIPFALDSTALADGYHELTAVTYEGTHVRTQTRVTRNVRIQNSSLSATFTPLFGGTNFAVEGAAQFSVVANTNNISKIELFSTGGLLALSNNQASTVFSIAGTNLGVGLHPFYALVTDADGKVYRTETKWIRLVGTEPEFAVYVSRFPLTISWNATAGRSYDVLSATNLADTFQLRSTLTATNSATQWIEPNADSPQCFYRIRVSP